MAGPITHIVLALKMLSLLPGVFDKQEFLIGTMFPDIRCVSSEITRESTHIEPISLDDVIKEPSSFRAGMLFHNLVDLVRISYFEPYFYDRFAEHDPEYALQFPRVMKTAEDACLYDYVKDWQGISTYFEIVLDEEKNLCKNLPTLFVWHELLQGCFRSKPTKDTLQKFIAATTKDQISDKFDDKVMFESLVNNEIFKDRLVKFYDNFECYLIGTSYTMNEGVFMRINKDV